MYRTFRQAALSAALATFAFAQTPQTAPSSQTATPSDTTQSFRGILMDASCQEIQNRVTTSESASSRRRAEAGPYLLLGRTQVPEVPKRAQQRRTRPVLAEPYPQRPAARERADL